MTHEFSQSIICIIMLSKSDIKLIKELFDDSFQIGFSQVRNHFENEVIKFKDEIITRLDKVLKELKTVREEQTAQSGNKSQIEDCENRIHKLEQILTP